METVLFRSSDRTGSIQLASVVCAIAMLSASVAMVVAQAVPYHAEFVGRILQVVLNLDGTLYHVEINVGHTGQAPAFTGFFLGRLSS